MDKNRRIARRKFIKYLSSLGLGISTSNALGGLHLLQHHGFYNNAVFYDGNYKALICIYLSGGNDSFNMLVPMEAKAYADYASTRSELAIERTRLLPIRPLNTNGVEYGLHPVMKNVQRLFETEKLAFVVNIGTLIQPTAPEEVLKESVPLPLGLFSHSDQTHQWMTGWPHERTLKGWGGKIADRMRSVNPSGEISMNISLSGTNVFQQGHHTIEFSVSVEDELLGIINYGMEDYSTYWSEYTRGIDSTLERNYAHPFDRTYAEVLRKARDAYRDFNAAMQQVGPLQTPFGDDELSKAMRRIVQIIKANQYLGFQRQIYFVEVPGWDNHDELLNNHAELLESLDTAVGSLWDGLVEIAAQDQVVVFVMTEFARTLTSNGNGTDHAWGGNVFVFGGQVRGRRFYGEYPDLSLGAERMIYRQALVPTLATDLYFAELAKWFGLHNSDIHDIFPNLSNFHSMSQGMPLGFLPG